MPRDLSGYPEILCEQRGGPGDRRFGILDPLRSSSEGTAHILPGYQPGGGPEDAKASLAVGDRDRWPSQCLYATETWKLADRMRKVWSLRELNRCTGGNINLFRSPSKAIWKRLPQPLRGELEEFSERQVNKLLEVLKPKRIVVIGLGTFDRLSGGGVLTLSGTTGRKLVKQGMVLGYPAYGVPHLSGSFISLPDLERLAGYFRSL